MTNDCQKLVDMSLVNLERWCAENDGDMMDFFGDGSIYGETDDGEFIVGYGIYGSANLVIGADCVKCGNCVSSKFSPMLKKALEDFREILENC